MIFTLRGLAAGAGRIVPVAAGVGVFGLIYGVTAAEKGLGIAETGLMSALVFAGAAQMLALDLWTRPVPVAVLALAAAVINLRYLVMTAALKPWFGGLGRVRAYVSLFFTADENWAVSIAAFKAGERDAAFHLGAGLMLYAVWLASGLAGRLGAGMVLGDDPAMVVRRWGLDFVGTAVFVALAVALWRGRRDVLPWLVAAGVALTVRAMLPGTWYLVAGGVAGGLAGAWRDLRNTGEAAAGGTTP